MKPSRHLRLLLIAGLVASNLLVFVLTAFSLYQSRQQYQLRAEVTTQNIARALDQSLSASVERIDLALRTVADELERQLASPQGISDASLNAFLARHEKRLPEVEAFRVANADGLVFLGSGVDRRAGASWADREYFAYHRDHADHSLQIAKPRMGRVARKPIVGFSQRYNYPDGRFAGVISAPIAVEYFSQLLTRFDLDTKGVIALRDADLGLIARFPAEPDKQIGQVGNTLVSDELRQLLASGAASATYRAANAADGIVRTFTFHRLSKAPMILIIGLAAEEYLANWHAEVFKMSAMAGGFLLLSLFLGFALLRLLTAAERREQALAESESSLTVLVEERTAALLETEAKASHILQSSADGLFGMDANGIVTFINPAGCSMLGYAAEQLVGREIHPVIHHSKPDGTAYPASECPALASLSLGHTVRVDNEVYWHADGHPVPVMYATHPIIQNGRITGSVTSFVDVSVQRTAAEAREQALLAAEHLARMRREFIANMSHEIRTPLNGILGFAEIGYRHCEEPEKVRNAFGRIRESGERLLAVINDVLDFSRIESDKLQIEKKEVVLADIVERALENFRERARSRQLEIAAEIAPDVPGICISDPRRLGQILGNLLSNAVKFTEAGTVSLAISRQGEYLLWRIADTGIGMTQEQLEVLFNPFQQADGSATRRFGGTGLGLAISKRLAELMGGDLTAESHPGSGSVFTLRLPCVPAETLRDSA